MIDLIDRDALKKAIGKVYACDWDDIEKNFHFAEAVNSLPSAEPERKKGEWIEDDYGFYRCSECGFEWDEPEMVSRFCPHCGAEMTRGGR